MRICFKCVHLMPEPVYEQSADYQYCYCVIFAMFRQGLTALIIMDV